MLAKMSNSQFSSSNLSINNILRGGTSR